MRVVTAVVVAVATAVSLQGCGGGGGPTPAPVAPTPAPTTPAPPPAPPAPPSPPGPIKPLRGICYGSLPNRNAPSGTPIPARDLMQVGYLPQWGSEGRDDLGLIKTMGGNAVRTYHSLGLETMKDHGKFLDRANEVGVHVIAGYHTQMICKDFNCFDSWKAATLAGYDKGFLKDGQWHPAVTILSLAEEPDDLNFMSSTTADCNDKTPNMCWLRAILSAMDGVLAAEKEKGINGAVSGVNMTVAWSSASRDSYDGKLTASIGIYGFYDLLHAIQDPKTIANYEPVNDVKQAYLTRWTNSVNANSDWDFISGKILPEYKQFEPTPWFLAGFATTSVRGDDMGTEATTMDGVATTTSFLGVVVRGLQSRYEVFGIDDGLFSLGAAHGNIQSTDSVCEEDVNSHHQDCHKFTVNCLDQQLAHGNNRAAPLAEAWGGKVYGPGVCRPTATMFSSSVKEVTVV